MLSDAEKTNPAVDFNRQYPDAVRFVSDGHVVRGAFTAGGFKSMQDALQHPDRYAQGETWVLGSQAGSSLNTAAIAQNLAAQYSADFIKEWHTFLTTAHVAPCGGPKEAANELNALAGPASPILELFFVISHNTAVADPKIKSVFQPAQALVDPNATDRLIGPGNAPYITALGQLGGALDLATQNPAGPPDLAALAPQVGMAKAAVQQSSQAFNVDPQMHTEKTIIDLMQAPIDCIKPPPPGAAANGGGKKMCDLIIGPLLGKFPFNGNPNSTVQANLAEVDTVFVPGTGTLWTNYAATLDKSLVLQGTQYGPAPAAPGRVNPAFVNYFNRAAHISSTLYPAGQKAASFTFGLRFIQGNGVSSATFVVDGQRIAPGATSQQFTWTGATAQKTTLVYDTTEAFSDTGTWSVFQMVRSATKITHTLGGYRLDYLISTVVAGHVVSTGKTVTFELSGPGADLLAGEGFSGLTCVKPAVF
jgi:type VI secretion system protein ImpL